MSNIVILGDTSHDFNFELADKYGVEMISYYLQMGEDHFKDGVDIDAETFYARVNSDMELKTGIPPVSEVLELLKKLHDERGITEAIAIYSNMNLTGMGSLYQSISHMQDDVKLYMYESAGVGSITGLYAILAAKLRDEGKSAEQIMEALEYYKDKSRIWAIFSDLSYLARGGRISKAKSVIGNFLHIAPILTINDGSIDVLHKVRGQKKSLQVLANEVKNKVGDSKRFYLNIFKGRDEEEFKQFKALMGDLIDRSELYYETILSPVLGVHSGPKAVGASVLILDK